MMKTLSASCLHYGRKSMRLSQIIQDRNFPQNVTKLHARFLRFDKGRKQK